MFIYIKCILYSKFIPGLSMGYPWVISRLSLDLELNFSKFSKIKIEYITFLFRNF